MPPSVDTGQKLQPVTIGFSSPGAQPPVFVAGDFTQPAWTPEEMEISGHSGSDALFSRLFHLPEGIYQYKFRLGLGDWWVCDESKETTCDDDGATNNRLVVVAAFDTQAARPSAPILRNTKPDAPGSGNGSARNDDALPSQSSEAPSFPHEMGPKDSASSASCTSTGKSSLALDSRQNDLVADEATPEDFADPTITRFPTGRENTLRHIETLAREQDDKEAEKAVYDSGSPVEGLRRTSANVPDSLLPEHVTSGTRDPAANLHSAPRPKRSLSSHESSAQHHEHLTAVPEYDLSDSAKPDAKMHPSGNLSSLAVEQNDSAADKATDAQDIREDIAGSEADKSDVEEGNEDGNQRDDRQELVTGGSAQRGGLVAAVCSWFRKLWRAVKTWLKPKTD